MIKSSKTTAENRDKNAKSVAFSKRQQTLFGFLFAIVLTLNIFNLTLGGTNVGQFAKRIISAYYGGEQIGKIKYVDSSTDGGANMVFSFFNIDYMLPFKNGTAYQNENGQIFINGAGDCLVVCPYKSVVKEITNENLKKTVVLDCGFNVCMFLINLDNVGVKVGQSLNKGDKIGMCFDSIIEAKITYKGKVYDKIKIKDGKFSLS